MEWMSKKLYKMIETLKQPTFLLDGWILITPELAKEFLKRNISNYRVKNKAVISKYAADMIQKLWQKNGEPIVFSKDGLLINGQHRLNAIIKSNTPVVIHVIFDADNCTIFDLQFKRTCVQVLRANGYSVSPISPSVARIIINGKVAKSGIGDGEVVEYVEKHYDTMKKVESIVRVRRGKEKMVAIKAACAAVAYCLLKTKEIPEHEIIDFFTVLNSNYDCGLERDVSPALVLRRQITSFDRMDYSISNRIIGYTYLAMLDFHNKVSVADDYCYPDDSKEAERLIREVQYMDDIDKAA